MDNYKAKYDFMYYYQGAKCAISKEPIPSYAVHMAWLRYRENSKVDMHHILHSVKWRRKKCHLFIDSICNIKLCYHEAHMNNQNAFDISDLKAMEIQNYFEDNNKLARWANNPLMENDWEWRLECLKKLNYI